VDAANAVKRGGASCAYAVRGGSARNFGENALHALVAGTPAR